MYRNENDFDYTIENNFTTSVTSGGHAYSLAYIQSYSGAQEECHPGARTARYDQSSKKWRLTVQLDEDRMWFLSVFVKSDGALDKFCLDEEDACDSHYEFRDEDGLRKKIYYPGDENKYLAEVLIRYVNMYGGSSLLHELRQFITAEFHFD